MIILPPRAAALAAPLGAAILLAGCQAVPRPAAPPPPPPPAPVQAAVPAPPPTLGWDVAPVTPGDWRYERQGAVGTAAFGATAAMPRVTLACRATPRQIELSVHGVAPAARAMTIRTSGGALNWAGTIADPPAGGGAILRVARPASDPGFDWMAYSRGRIAIEVEGGERLIVPAWAEISRVVEDCRN